MVIAIKNILNELLATRFKPQHSGLRFTASGFQPRAFGSRLRTSYIIGLLIVLALTSCVKSLPSLDNVNLTEWKNDKNGCEGLREKMMEFVVKQKDKLLSLSETDIVSLLGKPDETELYKRNEKFYKYYFSNGPGCASTDGRKSITLRFNAVGLLKEAVVD